MAIASNLVLPMTEWRMYVEDTGQGCAKFLLNALEDWPATVTSGVGQWTNPETNSTELENSLVLTLVTDAPEAKRELICAADDYMKEFNQSEVYITEHEVLSFTVKDEK